MLGRLGRCAGLLAAISTLTNAFLVSPGIASTSDSRYPDLAVSVLDPKSHRVALPCSECAFPIPQQDVEGTSEGENGFLWIQSGANSLVLDFTVSEDGKHLQLNGQPIYPPMSREGSYLEGLYVKQVPSASAAAESTALENVREVTLDVTGSTLKIMNEEPLTANGDVLALIRYQLSAVEDQIVTVDELEIKLLRTSEGELLILDITALASNGPGAVDGEFEEQPPPHAHHGPPFGPPHGWHHEAKECKTLPATLCKLKNVLAAKMSAMEHGRPRKQGGCRGRKSHGKHLPGHIRPAFMHPGHENGADDYHRRPHHVRPHGPHHHGHGHHGPRDPFPFDFVHAFGRGFIAILIPVFTGLVIGITFSITGMLLGRLIGFLWIKLARGGRRGSASAAHEEAVMDAGEDKAMLEQAPPEYEDAPTYTEVTEEK